jgi:hypothetical protein
VALLVTLATRIALAESAVKANNGDATRGHKAGDLATLDGPDVDGEMRQAQ